MGKLFLLVFSILTTGWATLFAQSGRMEVPVTLRDGLGEGTGSNYYMGHLSFVDFQTNSLKDVFPQTKGLPGNWTGVKIGIEYLNRNQFIYQNCKAGKLPGNYMQDSWFEFDQYCDTPIRCYLFFAEGIDADGNKRFVADRNNNLDFSDDPVFYSDSLEYRMGGEQKQIRIEYDTYVHGQVQTVAAGMYLAYNRQMGMYAARVSQHGVFNLNGKLYVVYSYGNDYLSFTEFMLWPADEVKPGQPGNAFAQALGRGQYLNAGGQIYAIRGVDRSRQVLVLEKDERPQAEIASLQTGFRLPSFAGNECTTQQSVSSESYKGKNLLLMCWSPGCGSCISEIPRIKELYGMLDRSKVEILGLTLHATSEMVTQAKVKHGISWSLLVASQENEIDEVYQRVGTPSFFLVNPEGVITGRSFNAEEIAGRVKDVQNK